MRNRKAIAHARLISALMLGIVLNCSPSRGDACGYHDNVTLARGVLNWTYPDALHVIGAMARAVSEKRLPAPTLGRERDPWGYHRTVRALHQYAHQLRVLSSETRPPAFSLLLIEPMLWTRFTSEGGDLQAQVHVSAPQAGDLVLVSAEDVMGEITNSRLSLGEAYRYGLIRLYGTDEQVAIFLTLYGQVGSVWPTPR